MFSHRHSNSIQIAAKTIQIVYYSLPDITAVDMANKNTHQSNINVQECQFDL